MLIKVEGLFPIVTTYTDPTKPRGRYLWGATKGTTKIRIPLGYPTTVSGPEEAVVPLLTLSDDQSGDALRFSFGWTSDGRHWVLFDVNPYDNEEDRRRMAAFPRMLSACATGDTNVTGDDPIHLRRSRSLYDKMRAAYNLTENQR